KSGEFDLNMLISNLDVLFSKSFVGIVSPHFEFSTRYFNDSFEK
ncbi:MAG: hypothetical protein K0R54_5681, partial [Clostridiaceae bacterium]|nr:hypothetical protein [Clostridiaceae bacterium]